MHLFMFFELNSKWFYNREQKSINAPDITSKRW